MFAKKSVPQMPRSPQVKAMAGSTFSVFGADTQIKGDVHAGTDLHIDGGVEGDVTCTSLVQGESSQISGAIKAESARLAGTVRGTITVRDVVILKSARIYGDVHYDALTIEQGAQVDGRLTPRVAGEDGTVVSITG